MENASYTQYKKKLNKQKGQWRQTDNKSRSNQLYEQLKTKIKNEATTKIEEQQYDTELLQFLNDADYGEGEL